jgi:hypothetical protein
VTPTNNSWVRDSKPTFSWEFSDPDDTDYQTAFEMSIAPEKTFSVITYNSNPVEILGSNYTIDAEIMDGTYYWRVRSRDNYGSWGPWSDPLKFNIDTKQPPVPKIECFSHPSEHFWYNDDKAVFDWNEPFDISGISGYSYVFDQSPFTEPPNNITMTDEQYRLKRNVTDYNGLVIQDVAGDGVWYFHLRAVDSMGSWSDTARCKIMVDTEGALIWDLTPMNITVGSTLDFKFDLNDTNSGIDLATITWRYSSEVDYRFDELVQNVSGLYSLSHRVQNTQDPYIEYYISVLDFSDPVNEVRYPKSGYLKINILDNLPPVIDEVNFDKNHNRYSNLKISVKATDNIGVYEAEIFFNDQAPGVPMTKNPDGTFSIEIDRMGLDDLSGYINTNEILFNVVVRDYQNNSARSPQNGNYNITLIEVEETGNGEDRKTEEKGFLDEIFVNAILFIIVVVVVGIILFIFIRKQSEKIAEDRHKLRTAITDVHEAKALEDISVAQTQTVDVYPATPPAPTPEQMEGGVEPAGYLPETASQPVVTDGDQLYQQAGLMTGQEPSEAKLSTEPTKIDEKPKKAPVVKVDKDTYISLPGDEDL